MSLPAVNVSVIVPVDVTGTTPQVIVAAQGVGYQIQVLGFLLTSSGSGNGVVADTTPTTLTQVACPGGGLMPPNVGWVMKTADNQGLTVAADTDAVRIVGHIVYMIILG